MVYKQQLEIIKNHLNIDFIDEIMLEVLLKHFSNDETTQRRISSKYIRVLCKLISGVKMSHVIEFTNNQKGIYYALNSILTAIETPKSHPVLSEMLEEFRMIYASRTYNSQVLFQSMIQIQRFKN